MQKRTQYFGYRPNIEHVGFAINVIQTAKNRKYMHIDFAINVIQTAKYRKYMHIEIASS